MQNIIPYSTRKNWRNATILVAEDDDVFRHAFSRILQNWGYRVLAAENGIAAMSVASTFAEPIDVLITDYFMPDFNGSELANRMIVHRPEIKVLYMTAYMTRLVPILSTFEACAGTIFSKPVEPAHIDEVIQALMANRFKATENS